MANKWLEVGTVLRSKDGDGSYVKIKENVTLSKGQILQLQNPRDKYTRLAKSGHITADEAQTRIESIPDYVMFDIVAPPAKG